MSGSGTLGLEQAVLGHTLAFAPMVAPVQVYVALDLAPPAVPPSEAAPGTEAVGVGYARMPATFALIATPANIAANTATIEFPAAGSAWGTIGYFELWDAPIGGNRLYWGPLIDPATELPTTITVGSGDIVRFSPGALAVQAATGSGGTSSVGAYLPLTGGTLTGPLLLAADPTTYLQAATKQYVDAHSGTGGGPGFLPLSGGTMLGMLTLSGPPTSALHGATKAYVDSGGAAPFLPLSGGSMTGPLTIPQLTLNSNVAHPGSASPLYPNNLNITDTVTGSQTGVMVGLCTTTTLAGSGQVAGPTGHVVGLEVFVNNTCAAEQNEMIATECGLYNNGGTLDNHTGYLHQVTVYSGEVVNVTGYATQYRPSAGTVGLWQDFVSPNISGAGGNIPQYLYCLRNYDPQKIIQTFGTVVNSTGAELSPAPLSGPWPGATRFYFGINRGAATQTLTGLHTNAFWCPVFFPGRKSFFHLGIQIATAVAGGTFTVAMYSAPYGVPTGSPILGPWSGSTSFTGNAALLSALTTLDAGMYMLGVFASSDAVGVLAYTENAAFGLWPPTTLGAGDVTPVSAGLSSFGANPPITTIANGSLFPAIWVQ